MTEAIIADIEETVILNTTYKVGAYLKYGMKKHFVVIDGTKYDIEFPYLPDTSRTCGNRAKIYDAYLIDWAKKNPHAVLQPVIVNHHEDKAEAVYDALRTAVEIDKRGLCLRPHRFPTTRHRCADGRVIEQTCDTRGLPIFAFQ